MSVMYLGLIFWQFFLAKLAWGDQIGSFFLIKYDKEVYLIRIELCKINILGWEMMGN